MGGNGDFTWCVPNRLSLLLPAVFLEDVDGFLRTSHVASLCDKSGSGLNQRLGFIRRDLILGCRWQGDVEFPDMFPRPLAIDVLEFVLETLGRSELAELLAVDLELGDGGNLVGGEAGVAGRDEASFAVGEGDDGCAKVDGFERGVLGDVTGARDGDAFASEGLLARASMFDHVFDVLVWLLAMMREYVGQGERVRRRGHSPWLPV